MSIVMLAKAAETTVELVQFYEKLDLIPGPQRNFALRQAYGPEHLRRLIFIRRGIELGFSIEQLRRLIALENDSDRDCAAVSAIAEDALRDIAARKSNLLRLEAELQRLVVQCRGSRSDRCGIIEALCPSHEPGDLDPADHG
jgi:DNA-binding transcriptional MerR regulator